MGPMPEPSIGDMLFYGLDPTPKAFTLFIHQTSVICASYQAVLIREDDETVVLAGDAHNPRFRYPGMLERLLEAKYGQNFAVKAGDGIVAIYINADTFYNRPKRDSCYANSLGIFGPAREHECDASTGEKLLREYTAAQERASRRCRAVEGWTEAQAPSARSLSNESSVPENVTAPFVLSKLSWILCFDSYAWFQCTISRPAKHVVVRANINGGDPWAVWSQVKKDLEEVYGSKNVLPCEQSGYLFIYIDRGDLDKKSASILSTRGVDKIVPNPQIGGQFHIYRTSKRATRASPAKPVRTTDVHASPRQGSGPRRRHGRT
ncbi:hypothetical protein J3459_005930 [Metarhizium acridum]|uniref:uncharacterized protein n=1 Tax=Metarhizium acridum TaxID=92637 RepID=UPI001C6AD8A4|nr:hypothetical protein J3458_005841 [Metarhizium acridum]KAG8428249.1 hypothetical protein J3459_005930 [Metarhizium acridum]